MQLEIENKIVRKIFFYDKMWSLNANYEGFPVTDEPYLSFYADI